MQSEMILLLFSLFEIDSMRKSSTDRRAICRISKISKTTCSSRGRLLHTI